MASMESFYGGRQGASFIIVKRFDDIDIPQVEGSIVYRKKWYAVKRFDYSQADVFPVFLLRNGRLVEKTAATWQEELQWAKMTFDGSTYAAYEETTSQDTTYTAPVEKAEGMRQCFEKGGDTTNIVNYGEYVIIDTVDGLLNLDSPNNGRVYRRGMNFDYNPVTNPLAGAEYIGQITGPKGEPVETAFDHLEAMEEDYPGDLYIQEYEPNGVDLVPGYDSAEEEYNDNIIVGWVNIRDVDGLIKKCKIGLQIPYLVQDFIAEARTQYYHEGDVIPSGSEIGDRLPANYNKFITRIDDGSHPFFEQWKLQTPEGIKGDGATNFEVFPTVVRALSNLYNDSALTESAGTAPYNLPIDSNSYNPNVNYVKLTNGKYASKNDAWKYVVRYKAWNYENKEAGEWQYVTIGKYNIIQDLTLSDDGTLTIYYTDSATQVESKAIPWIRSVSLNHAGHFKVTYNNDNPDRIVNTTGVETEGGIRRAVYETDLSTVTDAVIHTTDSTNIEGSGSQKLALEYNDSGTYTEIGQPLNYIVDTHVVSQSDLNDHPEDPSLGLLKGHICVYYSDPVRRGSSTIKLYSSRLHRDVLGWVDLGDIHGETNAQLTFAEYPSLAAIPNNPPEVIMGTTVGGVVHPDYRYMGWGATIAPAPGSDIVHLALYDYVNTQWVDVGPLLDMSAVSPNMTIAYQDDATSLKVGGFIVDKSTIRQTAY